MNRKTILYLVLGLVLLAVLLHGMQTLDRVTPPQADANSTESTAAPKRAPRKTVVRIPGPARSSDANERQRLADFLIEGDALYAAASAIVDEAPQTELQAAAIAGSEGNRFYERERRYQAALRADRVGTFHDPIMGTADFRLVGVEPFLYSAVADTLASCNAHDGRLDLEVARAILDKARRDFHGELDENWNPPDITDKVTGSGRCPE